MRIRMRVRLGSFAVLAVVGVLLVGLVAPTVAQAASTSGSNANGVFTLSIADQQADPDGATLVPIVLTWQGTPDVDRVVLDVEAIPMGSASVDSSAYEYAYDASAGTLTDAFNVSSGAGTYTVRGSVTLDGTTELTTSVSTSFTITPAPTTIDLVATLAYDSVTFSGRTTTQSQQLGTVGAEARVSLQKWDGGAWSEFDYAYADQYGNYSTVLYSSDSAATGIIGSQVRAVLTGTATFAESVSTEIVVGPPPVAVTASAVSRKGKLRIDVDPNAGARYWKFKVERATASGSWKKVGTYRTKGASETRTLNLRKGTYRVYVYPKFGYSGTDSSAVVLTR